MSKSTRQKKKIATTSQESDLADSPFSILDAKGLPDVPLPQSTSPRVYG